MFGATRLNVTLAWEGRRGMRSPLGREFACVAIVGAHLHRWQGYGDEGIQKVTREHVQIQLDPLNPAGRSHDLFFSSRVPDYRAGRFEALAYPERLVFETHASTVRGGRWWARSSSSQTRASQPW